MKRSFLEDEAAIPKQRNILFRFFGGGVWGGADKKLEGNFFVLGAEWSEAARRAGLAGTRMRTQKYKTTTRSARCRSIASRLLKESSRNGHNISAKQ
jgi:hypothetical protein